MTALLIRMTVMFVRMMYCYRFYSLLVVTVYMLNTFTNRDSLIDKNNCYVCMYDVLLQVLQFVSRDCVHVKYLY